MENNISKDPLLACLVTLCKHFQRTSSPLGLLAGVPLENNRLTLNTFVRAAERAGLGVRALDLPLRDIASEMLPGVLLLTDQRSCVILSLTSNGDAKIVRPESQGQSEVISLNQLESEYTGTLLSVFPAHRFDTRTEEPGAPVKRRWFWNVMQKAWAVYSEIIVASLLINIFALASPLFVMNVYDRVVPNQTASYTLWVLASGVVIVYVFDFVMRNLRSYFIDAAGRNIDMELSNHIFSHVLDIQMGQRPNSVGTLANTVQMFDSFREFITSATVSVVVDIPFVFIFLLTILFLGGWVVLVPIIAIPLVLLFGLSVQKPLDQMVRDSYRFSSEKHAVLVEALSSMEAIKGMGVESYMQRRWEQVVDAASDLNIRLRTLATLGINFSMLTQQLAVVAMVVAGVFAIQAGTMTTGALVACTLLTTRALVPISQLAGLIARYQQSKAAISALDKVMELPTERPADKQFLYLSKVNGDIEFRDVSFSYPNQSVPTLHNINLHIKPQEKVGIIGATGSGKSTILKLIMKFYQPTDGNILLEGFEQQQLDPAEFRHFMGYVPQDTTLFHGTIKENIIFGAEQADDQMVLRAAKLSTVDNFVAGHPDGFNRTVGERGQYLSGGQRQAVAIARALLLAPPVLVFDELGNSMDDRTISLLIDRLRQDIVDKTLVLVTHKAVLLNLIERLIVIDAGRIVADGPRDEILKQLSERKIRAAHVQS